MITQSPWRKFKKVELHRHLEGSVRLQTILEVAAEAGVTLPATKIEDLKRFALITGKMGSLKEVLDKFWLTQSVLATPAIVERVAYENVIDAYNDGIRVLELRYSPGFLCANHKNLSYDTAHEAICRGITNAKNDLAAAGKIIAVGLICIISRDQPMKEAEDTTAFAIAHRQSFVGFDLAGDEEGFDCKLFEKFFTRARKANLHITVHSGEARSPKAPQRVRDSIEILGAERIGHGLLIAQDDKTVEYVAAKGVALEICPTSNVYTHAVNTIREHPIRKLIEAGVQVTLNSDDPHIFGIDLTHEYDLLHKEMHFGEDDFLKLNQTALKVSFIHHIEAQAAWQKS